jgi:hypothetical protein
MSDVTFRQLVESDYNSTAKRAPKKQFRDGSYINPKRQALNDLLAVLAFGCLVAAIIGLCIIVA